MNPEVRELIAQAGRAPLATIGATEGERSSRVWDAVLQSVWAMEPQRLSRLVGVVHRWTSGVRLGQDEIDAVTHPKNLAGPHEGDASAGRDGQASPPYQNVGGVAVISVGGVIAKYASSVNGSSQPKGTSTQRLRGALQAAKADGDVSSVLLLIDSPGGTVAGVADFAAEVRAFDQQVKPVHAYIEDLGASAAYWIAASARRIEASATAAVGSIGVYTVVWDDSRAMENDGIKAHLVSSGGVKGAGAYGVQPTQEYLGAVKREINSYYEAFVAAVAAGRPQLGAEGVKALATGEVWIGPEAVAKGLADNVRAVNEVVREMQSAYGRGAPARSAGRGGADFGGANPAANGGGTNTGLAGKEIAMNGTTSVAAAGGSGGGEPTVAAAPNAPNTPNTPSTPSAAAAAGHDVAAARAQGVAAEQARQAGIRGRASKFMHVDGVPELVTASLADTTMSVEAFGARLLDKIGDGVAPLAHIGVQVGPSGDRRLLDDAVIGLADRASGGKIRNLLAAGGSKADLVARRVGGASLKPSDVLGRLDTLMDTGHGAMRLEDVGRLCLRASGRQVPGSMDALWHALRGGGVQAGAGGAHTSSDFPYILSTVGNQVMLTAFAEVDVTWSRWCAKDSLSDYKLKEYLGLSEAPNLALQPEGKPAKKGSFNERRHQIQADAYSRQFDMTYQMFRNDDLGAFSRTPMLLGAAAKRLPEDLVFALLTSASGDGPTMSDGVALFHATHKNLASAAALSATTVQELFNKMMLQTGYGDDAAKLGLVPKAILVPVELQWTAEQIRVSEFDPAASNKNVANTVRNRFEVIVSERLSAASATAFYGVADKSRVESIIVGFLDGREEPVLTQLYSNDPFNMGYQASVMGVGVSAVAWEGINRNPGS
ncbi:MAG: S49 family peptidase [Phycisphaerales bacterium]